MYTNLLLSLVGAVIFAVVGTFWYSDATPMGKLHKKYLGFDKLTPEERKKMMEQGKARMGKMYAAQMALSFLMSFSVVYVVTLSIHNGLSFWMSLGFVVMNWLCFVVPTVGTGVLWSGGDRKLAWGRFFSDSLATLVSLLLIAVLASRFA
jgi:hypothetical protein